MAEQLLVRERVLLRADELPPADLLVGVHPPFAARRDDLPDFRGEEDELVVSEVEVTAEQPADIVQRHADVVDRPWRSCGDVDRPAAEAGERDAGGVDQIVGHSAVAARNPAHRVGDVAVEAGEEAEAVFARKVRPAVRTGAGNAEAPGLAAGNRQQLVDLDVELTLDQFMRSAEPGDPAAEDDDFGNHGISLDSYVLPFSSDPFGGLFPLVARGLTGPFT